MNSLRVWGWISRGVCLSMAAACVSMHAACEEWRDTGKITAVEITHDAVVNPPAPGAWRISGTLEVLFSGRIDPHEGTSLRIFGGNAEAIEGRFDAVKLPPGWLCEVAYEEKDVVLRRFRPERAPAFPCVEGFGKYTLGGRGGKGIIDSQRDVGGWPVLASSTAPPDADHDGMPDAWEQAHGLDPARTEDGAEDPDGDGYTCLEDYLNTLAER